jgi:hypothetical protein
MCFLQDDVVKFVSKPASPPRLVEIPDEGRERPQSVAKSVKGTTLRRKMMRSRAGLPHVPLVQDPPTSLEASLPAPPRRPRNVARKRVAKKLKVTETTSQEVSFLE